MRRRLLHPVFALLVFLPLLAAPAALAANAVDSRDPRSMTFEPVKIPTPNAERVVLDNGIVVYLLPDIELPLVTVSAMIRTGSIYEPPEKIGLAELTGVVMRTGGTDRMSADQVDETLEYLAANVSGGIGQERGGATLDIMEKDFPNGLAIVAHLLPHPAFEAGKM